MIRTTSFRQSQPCNSPSYQSSGQRAYLSRQLVLFHASEIQKIIEMKGGELCLSEYLVAEFASTFHDCT